MEINDILQILEYIFQFGGWGVLIFLVIYTMLFPDRAEKFYALLWKLVTFFYKNAEKKYIAHDIQSKVNDYLNNYLSREICGFKPANIKLEWVDENQTAQHFKDNGKIILRMTKSDSQDKNLVNAAMIFIAENVLYKAKKYISSKQRESIDVFVGKKFFEIEQKDYLNQFVEDFLQNSATDEKINDFLYKYKTIDENGLFYPVFIQEMIFLGEKVFANSYPKDEIYKEVSELVAFLNNFASRKIGETLENKFVGKYSRFGIMIVGESWKVESSGTHPYTKYVQKLFSEGYETVYLVGDSRKEDFINTVLSEKIKKEFDIGIFNNRKYQAFIFDKHGKKVQVNTYLLVLRKKNPKTMIDLTI